MRELDAVLAKKNAEYRRLKEARERSEQEESSILDSSAVSERSFSSTSQYSKGGSSKKQPKTFVTSGKTRVSNNAKEEKSVSIYKPNIALSKKKDGKRTDSSSSKRSVSATPSNNKEKDFIATNIENSAKADTEVLVPLLSSEEEEKVQKLMIEFESESHSLASVPPAKVPEEISLEVSDPSKALVAANEERSVALLRSSISSRGHNKSVISPEALNKIDEIDESLRQLVPIDKWEQWSIKTSIRSITTDSLTNYSAPSKCLDTSHTLDSLAVKGGKKVKKVKPGDEFLKKLAEEREERKKLADVNNKIIALQKEHRKLKGVITEEDKIVLYNFL